MTDDGKPYENTLSIEELRREVRWLWDSQRLLMRAIRDKADMPPPRVLKDLSSAAKWPDDHNIGKMLQRKYGLDIIPPVSECEGGAGVWSRMLAGLRWDNNSDLAKQIKERATDPKAPPFDELIESNWKIIVQALENNNEGIGCLNMLVLCGELGGKQPNETYPQYLRRLIDFIAAQPVEQK